MSYGISYLEKMYAGKRKIYYGVLTSPKSVWRSRAEVERSRAFKRLKKLGHEPRVRKITSRRKRR